MIFEDIEFVVSHDIVQGEDVPFYILWKRDDIKKFKFKLIGFEKIVELYNVSSDIDLNEELVIDIDKIKTNGYLGGILRTLSSSNPYQNALLTIKIELKNNNIIELNEKRTLFTTIIESIRYSPEIQFPRPNPAISIKLKGENTVFIGVNSAEDSQIKLELPENILLEFTNLSEKIITGMVNLKKRYPQHSSFIQFWIEMPPVSSADELADKMNLEFEKVKDDEEFGYSFMTVFKNAFDAQISLKDLFFRPLIEYLEGVAAKKAILIGSPFFIANIPKGTHIFKGSIKCENLLEKNKKIPQSKKCNIDFKFKITSSEDISIPLKDLIDIERDIK